MNDFGVSTNKLRKIVYPLGNCRSMRNVRSPDTTSTTDSESSGGMNYMFDVSSRNIRRYIIEDIMFISVGELVTLVVDIESYNSKRWESIAEIQRFDYDTVMIDGRSFYQIPSQVRSNNRKDEFASGYHDNDTINYLI